MKSNSKKHRGFGLIEVVISMALIAIISVGIYNGYMLMIRQIKDAQVKQKAALCGKQIIEEIKGAILNKNVKFLEDSDSNATTLKLNKHIELQGTKENQNDSFNLTEKLNSNYEVCKDDSQWLYTRTITLEKARNSVGQDIDLNKSEQIDNSDENSNSSISNYTFYLSREERADRVANYYIRDVKENSDDNNKKELISDFDIVLNVYMETKNDNKTITIKDKNGELLLSKGNINKDKEINLYVNFNDYKKSDKSKSELKHIELNLYNRNEDVPNLYIQKSKDLDRYVDIKAQRGKINIYDNRAADETKARIGTLYNIKVEIKNRQDDSILFTGNSNQNIDIN